MNYLENYLNEKEVDSALLINGKWGSGKTYFYNNVVKKMIEENGLIPVYISVYGRKSSDELKKSIMNEFLRQKFKSAIIKPGIMKDSLRKVSKLSEEKLSKIGININEVGNTIFDSAISGTITKALDEIGKYTVSEINLTDIFSEFNKIVLVIDDFERSRIDIIELMGNVYRLIEEESIKTIIVANEEEITNTLIENNELKIQTAINALRYQEKKYDDDVIVQIEKMKSNLYNDHYHYEKMKEKLIGYTIELHQDTCEVLNTIINEHCSKSSIFNEIKNDILNIFVLSEYVNYRLLSRSLKLFGHIETILDTFNYPSEEIKKNTIKTYLLLGIIQYIETKIQNHDNEHLLSIETKNISFLYGKDYPSTVLRISKKYSYMNEKYKLLFINSAQKIISFSMIREDEIRNDVSLLNELYKPLFGDVDPLIEMLNFRFNTTEKTNKLANDVMKNIQKGRYGSIDFEKAFRMFLFLSENRILDKTIESILNFFDENLNCINNENERDGILRGYSFSNTLDNQSFNRIIEISRQKFDDETASIKKSEIVELFNELDTDFQQNINKLEKIYTEDGSRNFFQYLNSNDLFKLVLSIDDANLFKLFSFIDERRKFAYDSNERTAIENISLYVEENINNIKGLKYFYLKSLIKIKDFG